MTAPSRLPPAGATPHSDERDRRVVRVACVMAQVLECHPAMAWESVRAVNRGTGWLREGSPAELDDVSLRRAWNLAWTILAEDG